MSINDIFFDEYPFLKDRKLVFSLSIKDLPPYLQWKEFSDCSSMLHFLNHLPEVNKIKGLRKSICETEDKSSGIWVYSVTDDGGYSFHGVLQLEIQTFTIDSTGYTLGEIDCDDCQTFDILWIKNMKFPNDISWDEIDSLIR